METEEYIKQQLQELLLQDPVDYSKVIALSNKLADCDPNNVRFSVDADIITRLGNELVARQETALSELVKNAYDADATRVVVSFEKSSVIGGTLVIRDNGCGMTREQLINGFMRLSSSDKVTNPISNTFLRKKSGRKGIGRFAVQRLGTNLTIITQSSNDDRAYKVVFDWSCYARNKDLSAISNSIVELPKQERGTTLIIGGLRDVWTEVSVRRVYRYISGILQPLRFDSSGEEVSRGVKDPGFVVQAIIKDHGKISEVNYDVPKINDYAIASFDAHIDENGKGHYSINSKDLKIKHEGFIGLNPDDEESVFKNIKNVRLHSLYFLDNHIPKSQKTLVQEFLRTQGSIRLYRNGFRVLPYGEPNNDWVSLDRSLRRRSILPQHGNENFLGFVEIGDESGNFEETSSREGLFENAAFIELANFVYRVLISGVIYIAQVRNVKVTSGQKKDANGNWEIIELKVRNMANTLDDLDRALNNPDIDNPVGKEVGKQSIKKIKAEIRELKQLQKKERARNEEEKVILRILSSVGLTVEQFVHEIKYYLNNINADISFLLDRISNDVDALKRLVVLNDNFSTFHSYVSYFDSVVSNNVNRELRPIEMRSVVRPFFDSMKSDAMNSGIVIEEPVFYGYNLYSKPMHPSEWTSILFNFYTNSKKAIRRAVKDEGRIRIECGKEKGIVYLEFSDNGDGIPKEIEDQIFNEFFTTSTQRSLNELNSMSEVTGTGLGLSIVRDIVRSYKGEVYVVNPRGEYSTCIRVEIPALSDREILSL